MVRQPNILAGISVGGRNCTVCGARLPRTPKERPTPHGSMVTATFTCQNGHDNRRWWTVGT